LSRFGLVLESEGGAEIITIRSLEDYGFPKTFGPCRSERRHHGAWLLGGVLRLPSLWALAVLVPLLGRKGAHSKWIGLKKSIDISKEQA
jgi:hypothetical protein